MQEATQALMRRMFVYVDVAFSQGGSLRVELSLLKNCSGANPRLCVCLGDIPAEGEHFEQWPEDDDGPGGYAVCASCHPRNSLFARLTASARLTRGYSLNPSIFFVVVFVRSGTLGDTVDRHAAPARAEAV